MNLPVVDPPAVAPAHLDDLSFQVTGTLCNLTCRHCFISCSPHNHAFGFLGLDTVRRFLDESVPLGVKEYYFTGGEPFLHKDMPAILELTLQYGPATVLTNGTVFKDDWLGRLRAAEDASVYSLEFRVSLDGFTAAENDPVRGEGTFERILHGVRQLLAHDFLPIVTVTRTHDDDDDGRLFDGFVEILKGRGNARPRIKILPTLRLGAEVHRQRGYRADERVTAELLDGFDQGLLVCNHSRVITDRGVCVCPILIEAPDARLGATLEEAARPFALSHQACFTCYQYGTLSPMPPANSATPDYRCIAVFGGVYSNHLALAAAIADAQLRGVEALFCLGDLGAFGPHPDQVFPLLRDHGVQCIQGNYDHSIGNDLADCQCGYTDPRDNHFARISYVYTFANTSPANRAWLRDLPGQRRIGLGNYSLLLCHGSPRKMNEFLWESTTSSHFLEHLLTEHQADVVLATHTGLKWHRRLTGERHFVNVGVLGRPENDGRTNVWYALLTAAPDLQVEFVPVVYDYERLANEMRGTEKLPETFVETILTGWWTTCLEILPQKERRRGKF